VRRPGGARGRVTEFEAAPRTHGEGGGTGRGSSGGRGSRGARGGGGSRNRPEPAAVYGFVGWITTLVSFGALRPVFAYRAGRPASLPVCGWRDTGCETAAPTSSLRSVCVATVVFFLWAYLPANTLHSLGVTYYPSRCGILTVTHAFVVATHQLQRLLGSSRGVSVVVLLGRYWAIALPAYVCVCVVMIVVVYTGLNIMCNPPLDSFSTFTGQDCPASTRPP
jgi:hypothetical protein